MAVLPPFNGNARERGANKLGDNGGIMVTAIKIFLIVCNLAFAYISAFGFNERVRKGKEVGEYEALGCMVGVLMFVFNAIFIWR